ncbi:MAG TPA: hypothetical protein VGO58_11305, partial [Chitinophagaceae bacterium]|nr:hypothetical protein [Chitinophagaceae bacterium]
MLQMQEGLREILKYISRNVRKEQRTLRLFPEGVFIVSVVLFDRRVKLYQSAFLTPAYLLSSSTGRKYISRNVRKEQRTLRLFPEGVFIVSVVLFDRRVKLYQSA